jgi:hypothetical protein
VVERAVEDDVGEQPRRLGDWSGNLAEQVALCGLAHGRNSKGVAYIGCSVHIIIH